MHAIDLKRFDLNLLVVFDTLMRERHVGRAADALGLTQPAVSHALSRLRLLLDNPLFVKHARGMRPTARAESLAAPIAGALESLRATLSGSTRFVPRDATPAITIGAADYVGLTLMPQLMAAVRDAAPGLDLRQRAVARETVIRDLRRREIDLAIGPMSTATPDLEVTPLFSEHLVLVARRGHRALRRKLTPADFADLPHLLVSPGGDPFGSVDDALREAGLVRRIVLTVPHFLSAPFVVGATDLVSVLAERVANQLAKAAGIAIGPPWTFGLGRLKDPHAHPAIEWVSQQIKTIARKI